MTQREKILLQFSEKKNVNIEFALVDDLESEMRGSADFEKNVDLMTKKTSNLVSMFNEANKLLSEVEGDYNENRKQFSNIEKSINSIFNKIQAQSKEIGVSISSLPFYKKYTDTTAKLKSGNSDIQANWNKVYKYKK